MTDNVPLRRVLQRSRRYNFAREATLSSLTIAGATIPRSGEDGLGAQAPSEEAISKYLLIEPGQLVVNPMWLTGGSIGVATIHGAVSPAYRVYDIRAGWDPRFIHHCVRSTRMRSAYRAAGRGDTTFDRAVSAEDFESLEAPKLDLEEQRRIADFLDARVARIDQIIAARQHQALLVDGFRAAQFDRAFARFSEGTLDVRRTLATAPDYGVLPDETSYDPTLPRYLRTTDIGPDGRIRDDESVTVAAEHLRTHRLRRGDILVSRSGNTIGKCAMFDGSYEAVFAGYLVRLRFASLDPLTYWFFSQTTDFSRQLWANAVQSTIPNFNAERYASMRLPDVRRRETELHEVLAPIVECSEDLREVLATSVNRFQDYKESLITAAVTGEFDVTTASTRVPEE